MKIPIHYIVWLWQYYRENGILIGHYMEGYAIMKMKNYFPLVQYACIFF